MMIKVTFENGKTDMFPMTAGVFVNANNELKKLVTWLPVTFTWITRSSM